MTTLKEKQFKLTLCGNGLYYVYKNNDLITPYIVFDKFNKESAEEMMKLINELFEESQQLQKENVQLRRQNKALKESSLADAYCKYIGVKEELYRS